MRAPWRRAERRRAGKVSSYALSPTLGGRGVDERGAGLRGGRPRHRTSVGGALEAGVDRRVGGGESLGGMALEEELEELVPVEVYPNVGAWQRRLPAQGRRSRLSACQSRQCLSPERRNPIQNPSPHDGSHNRDRRREAVTVSSSRRGGRKRSPRL